MIEVVAGSDEAEPQAAVFAQHPFGDDGILGETTLKGEIMNAKCYLGGMNPGNLKAHRACAIHCIQGGIPLVLLLRDRAGGPATCCWSGRMERR
ncbi:MAG: hypothetical protein OSB65_06930 [Roseibacillus sp.]|nr:hypothetical protein [Roseibacillus sp.]